MRARASRVIALATSLFVLVVSPLYLLPEEVQLPVFLSLMLVYIFLKLPLGGQGGSGTGRALDAVLVVLSTVVGIYLIANLQALLFDRPGMPTAVDVFWGIVAILLVLEGCRRTSGLALVIIAVAFIVYGLAGPLLPGILFHNGYSPSRIAYQLYLTRLGMYGLPVKVMLRQVMLFIIFGNLLQACGGIDFLINLARALTRGATAGLAKVAVMSSGFMGMVSGSGTANVATTGAVTIPAMKQSGYAPQMAAAVEAVASTGGQLIPPVLGAAAFLMADYLKIPYATICVATLVPGILYYFSAFMGVHFYAQRTGLKEPLDQQGGDDTWSLLQRDGILLLPIGVLAYFLFGGYSPTFAGLWGVVSVAVIGIYRSLRQKVGPVEYLTQILRGLMGAGESSAMLTAASAAAGLVMGMISLTGIGARMSSMLISVAGDNLLLLLLLTALTSLIMGMGAPTVVCYIVLATLVAPTLVTMGVQPLLAHLFVFYFGILSLITPPVALAVYAASAIAKTDPMQAGWTAVKLALPALLIPFFFIYSPSLALQGPLGWETVWVLLTATVGVLSCAAATQGFFLRALKAGERVLLLAGGVLLIEPGVLTDLLGVVLVALPAVWLLRWRSKQVVRV